MNVNFNSAFPVQVSQWASGIAIQPDRLSGMLSEPEPLPCLRPGARRDWLAEALPGFVGQH
ncbi:hypothetical protein RGU70_13110 [Herbaspirillum sp. RTI4]|uniref:hypothetical protein n=1 Tax=Herbaspirillum sp. RTI4 TaxID=3048640 RepID=UPI002AB55C2E|nr:hypothetical protein [Herbaspirillum sp. RTI4]MDY7579258.1 hypothetical protein [Herbaspirillum sp. RTI4]MEA9982757.1 hypothetical protein [Herbaspirillum sp. RTI4]